MKGNEPCLRAVARADLPVALSVIHRSFATVADEFRLTRENCPQHTSFLPLEYLETPLAWGWSMYGLLEEGKLIGFVSLSDKGQGVYELHNLAVRPECRHKGYGKLLLDRAKEKVREQGGHTLKIGIINESAVLKSWYAANGFALVGAKKFDHLPFTVEFMEWGDKK